MKPVEPSLSSFLKKLEEQLADLPAERRAEIVSETRSHLEAMMSARRADGLDEAATWLSAQVAFGDAEAIGQALSREWKRAPRYETEGTPLSKQEKIKKLGGRLVLMLLFYPTFLGIAPWLQSHHLLGIFLLVVAPLVLLFNARSLRKQGVPSTKIDLFGRLFCYSVVVIMAISIDFADDVRRLGWDTLLDTWLSPLLFGFFFLLILWQKRENKKVLPWRRRLNYASNPIAAEEEYRLGMLQSIILSISIPCIGAVWMGWQFLGMGYALMVCSAILGFNLLLWRWLR